MKVKKIVTIALCSICMSGLGITQAEPKERIFRAGASSLKQGALISMQVVDAKTGKPLPGVTITVRPEQGPETKRFSVGTAADQNGRVAFWAPPSKLYVCMGGQRKGIDAQGKYNWKLVARSGDKFYSLSADAKVVVDDKWHRPLLVVAAGGASRGTHIQATKGQTRNLIFKLNEYKYPS